MRIARGLRCSIIQVQLDGTLAFNIHAIDKCGLAKGSRCHRRLRDWEASTEKSRPKALKEEEVRQVDGSGVCVEAEFDRELEARVRLEMVDFGMPILGRGER